MDPIVISSGEELEVEIEMVDRVTDLLPSHNQSHSPSSPSSPSHSPYGESNQANGSDQSIDRYVPHPDFIRKY